MDALRGRRAAVEATIAAAARRAGRDPAGVRVVAVTKTLPPATVRAALDVGFADVGENYVQEAKAKRTEVPEGRWHLIGGLQRNKVRVAVATFDCIHTIDGVEIATAVASAAREAGRRIAVLVQVNVAGDTAKRGIDPGAARALCEHVVGLESVRLEGLMTIGAMEGVGDAARDDFRTLRELRDDVARRLGVELPHLSMGMSDDFEVAVEEGATLVRLGRVLFGPRQSGPWREGR